MGNMAHTWNCSKKCETLQHFSSVVNTAVLCTCWRSTVHSVVSPAEKYRNCPPCGPVRSISTRSALCLLARYMRFLLNIQKQEIRPKTVHLWVEEKKRNRLRNVIDKISQKYFEPRRLIAVFLRRQVDSPYLYLMNIFFAFFSCHDSCQSANICLKRYRCILD